MKLQTADHWDPPSQVSAKPGESEDSSSVPVPGVAGAIPVQSVPSQEIPKRPPKFVPTPVECSAEARLPQTQRVPESKPLASTVPVVLIETHFRPPHVPTPVESSTKAVLPTPNNTIESKPLAAFVPVFITENHFRPLQSTSLTALNPQQHQFDPGIVLSMHLQTTSAQFGRTKWQVPTMFGNLQKQLCHKQVWHMTAAVSKDVICGLLRYMSKDPDKLLESWFLMKGSSMASTKVHGAYWLTKPGMEANLHKRCTFGKVDCMYGTCEMQHNCMQRRCQYSLF